MAHTRVTEFVAEPPEIERAAADAVAAALARHGDVVRSLRRRELLVDGDDVRVGFDVTTATTDGRGHDDVVWAARVRGSAPPGTAVVATPHGEFGVWRHPHDPVLPGLVRVIDGSCDVVRDTGVDTTAVTIVTVTPLRHAVVRVGTPTRRVYVKVTSPGAAARIAAVHERLGAAGIAVPPVLAVDDAAGVVVLGELAGTELGACLTAGRAVPDVASIATTVERIAGVGADGLDDGPVAPSLADSLDRALARVRTADPRLGARCDRLRETLDTVTVHRWETTVHGDLHDGQLLVADDGSLAGVVDLDDVGRGDLADDCGRLHAGLRIRALTAPQRRVTITAYADAWRRRAAALVGDDQLRHRSAIALVGLATGPWRTGTADRHGVLVGALDEADALLR